ncbi:methyl-accepting chemotaxis protein [Oscillatoria salina]|uniref:methyl-accepting chemotaxis protein n=1 Tax=Oscillatoria salina TaxID=331517 RepID=UPI0013B9F7BB|nr:methyl-accepting chemotaxis protein [Oscillatoria salina]MBZ8180353.1 chemotaxis protein [Oscillatoria salina IIICB1]NET87951.1 chemotaxis protein [Kamptonema sp. SIO1D9]
MGSNRQPAKIESIESQKSSLEFLSWLASIAVIIIGSFVIIGWMFDITTLKSVIPGLVTMKANTAFGFIFGGTSLLLWHRQKNSPDSNPAALICAIAVLLIGLLTLIQYGFDVNLGIDELIFRESGDVVATASPGRMAPNSAVNFLLLGSALVLFCIPRPNYLPAQFLTILAFLVAFLGFLGYIYGNAVFYKFDSSFTAMALHTAVAFILLCVGILLASKDAGVMTVVLNDSAGGMMAQRLFPAAILIPPILCWLILVGFRREIYSPEMGISLIGMLNVIIFSVLIWWSARSLGSIDIQRRQAQASLKQAFQDLEVKAQEREIMANQLATTFSEITTTMNELDTASRTTAEQASAADSGAKKALNLSQQGIEAVERTEASMTRLQENVEAIAAEILRTQQQAGQIGDISRMVRNLANQTNMLALNASIEAVRAGEHGKGFGVVATEIRKLADQSKEFAEKIGILIAEINQAVNSTVRATDEGIKTTQSSVLLTRETAASFQGVAAAIDEIVLNNQQIALTANQQAAAISQVVNVVNEVNYRTN